MEISSLIVAGFRGHGNRNLRARSESAAALEDKERLKAQGYSGVMESWNGERKECQSLKFRFVPL